MKQIKKYAKANNRNRQAKMLIEIGDWCITKDRAWGGGGEVGIYADHIKDCRSGDEPIVVGDCCWASDDKAAICFYCSGPVPPEIQALVILQTTL